MPQCDDWSCHLLSDHCCSSPDNLCHIKPHWILWRPGGDIRLHLKNQFSCQLSDAPGFGLQSEYISVTEGGRLIAVTGDWPDEDQATFTNHGETIYTEMPVSGCKDIVIRAGSLSVHSDMCSEHVCGVPSTQLRRTARTSASCHAMRYASCATCHRVLHHHADGHAGLVALLHVLQAVLAAVLQTILVCLHRLRRLHLLLGR